MKREEFISLINSMILKLLLFLYTHNRVRTKNSEYLFTTDKGRNFKYRDFKDSYFDMVMNDMGWNYTPMYCRNTFRRLLAKEKVRPFFIKKLMGTKSQMTLTEKVYIHPEVKALIAAIDKL